jgi:hypothetical protein
MEAQPVKRQYIKNPHAKGTPEHAAEEKRRARERWAKNKEKYRPAPTTSSPGSEPPTPPHLPITWTTPSDLVADLGETVTLPAEWSTWPMFHVRRQKDLSVTTIKQYKSYYFRLPQKDIYDVVRFIVGHDAATQNQFAKAGLSYTCQQLYEMIYVNRHSRLATSAAYRTHLHKMMVYSELNKRTKKVSYEHHINQEATPERHANTVEWTEWVERAKRFVRRITSMKEPTARDRQEGLVAAVYSMLPPVRLDWNDVEVKRVTKKQLAEAKGEKGKNILYMAPADAIMTWGEFKNVASFGADAPLRQPMPAEVHRVFKKLLVAEDSTPFKLSNFSTFLTGVAETITGKKFSNRLMRSSFIRHWHNENSKEVIDVQKTRAMMRLVHQTNLEVHLAYQKCKEITPDMAD